MSMISEKVIKIAMLCDKETLASVVVALYSLIQAKNTDTIYQLYIITNIEETELLQHFSKLTTKSVSIEIIKARNSDYIEKTPINEHRLNRINLCRFEIANLLPNENKVLFLHCDILVQKDLLSLYSHNIDDYYAGVIKKPLTMQWLEEENTQGDYFDHGVLLLNLEKLRKEDVAAQLLAKKLEPLTLHHKDQDIFNFVFENHVMFFDVTYNFLYTLFLENPTVYTLEHINTCYGTSYKSLEEISKDAYIIHFTSRYKPWQYANMVYSKTWRQYFKKTSLAQAGYVIQQERFHGKHPLIKLSLWEKLIARFF